MKKLTIIAFFIALFANKSFAAEVNVFSARPLRFRHTALRKIYS